MTFLPLRKGLPLQTSNSGSNTKTGKMADILLPYAPSRNENPLTPSAPSRTGGMADAFDTICTIRRLLKPDTHTSRRCGSSQFTTSAPQIKQGYFDLGLRGRRGLLPPFPHRLQARLLFRRINSNQDGFCFCPLDKKNVTKSGFAHNGGGFTNLQ